MKSKEPEDEKENVILNALQPARQEQYSWLKISLLPFCEVFRGMSKAWGNVRFRLSSIIRRVKL